MKSKNKLFNFDKQCIFCKYKYDKDACFDATYNHNYECPSISNILHGKIYKLPVIKQVYNWVSNIRFEKEMKAYEENYINEYETQDMLFVWGVISYDELTSNKANLYTMNDLDLIYHKDKNKYSLSVETIYMFNNKSTQYRYMQSLLDKFTNWMNENNYDITKEFALFKVFTDGISINTKFDSIEEAYAAFKMMVNGFCSLEKTN